MENVSGMVKGKMKLIFADILRELKASGYVVSARLLNAMYFGVPQSRERMIFIGVREDLGKQPSHPKAETKPIFMKRFETEKDVYLSPERCKSIDEHAPKQKAKGNSFHPVFLSENKSCCTLPKSRSGNGSLYFASGKSYRYPNEKELKYIGSYPFGFQFVGSDGNTQNRIGNSVPPLFMRSIARHIRSKFFGYLG